MLTVGRGDGMACALRLANVVAKGRIGDPAFLYGLENITFGWWTKSSDVGGSSLFLHSRSSDYGRGGLRPKMSKLV